MEVDKLTAEMVRFMLFKAYKQPDVPVKREELTQLITENYKQRNLTAAVIANAQVKLKDIFGLELVEIHYARQSKSSKNSASQAPTPDVKVYVLKSIVPEDLCKKFIETSNTAAPLGFAVVVVGILQLAGDRVPEGISLLFVQEFHYSLYASGMWEYILKAFWRVIPELEGRCLIRADTLWTQLRRMGINEVDTSHPVFGNIREAIQTLVKQRYIRKEKVASNDGDTWVFDLAERAQDANFKTQVQAFIGKIVNGNDERR